MSIMLRSGASVLALCAATTAAWAQAIGAGLQPEYVIVTADRSARADPAATDMQITAAKAQEQINTVNTEDMLKYAPSLMVRKRHYGDTQDPVATRTSGVGASARNLIFVDGIMISSPIGNNNTAASPAFRRRRAARHQPHRCALWPLLGALCRQLHRRHHQHHHPHARAVRALCRRHRRGAELQPIRHRRKPSAPGSLRAGSATAMAPSPGGCRPITWIPPASRWAMPPWRAPPPPAPPARR